MATKDRTQTAENGAEKIQRLDNPEYDNVVLELRAAPGGNIIVFVGEPGPDGEGFEIAVPSIKLISAIANVG